MPTTQKSVMQKLSELVYHKASQLTYLAIDPTHVVNAAPSTEPHPIEAGRDYFRLWLNEMWLSVDQGWLRDRYPVVHSMVTLNYGAQTLELPYVAGPLNMKGVSLPNLGKAISLNHKLTTLLPFNGGTVELEAGLLAIPGKDVVGSLLKVLGDFASLVVVPQLSGALQVAEKVSSGLQEIVNPSQGSLHLGLHQTFGGSGPRQLTPGYHVVIQAKSDTIDPKKLWVVNDRLQHGTSAANSTPLSEYDYMLLQIERTSERDDWGSFTSVETPFNAAVQALSLHDESTAQVHLQTAKMVALTSPDFTQVDRLRVIDAIDKKFSDMKNALATKAPKAPREPEAEKASAEAEPIHVSTEVMEFIKMGMGALNGEERQGRRSTPLAGLQAPPSPPAHFEEFLSPAAASLPKIRLDDIMKEAISVDDAFRALRGKGSVRAFRVAEEAT